MTRMGCTGSSSKIGVSADSVISQKHSNDETVVAALARIDNEIIVGERAMPAARLMVVDSELETIHQEINSFEESTRTSTKDNYAQTMHQMFVSLDLYRRPVLATENEDFVANVNRKEMQRLELGWLRRRQAELVTERTVLHSQILQLRSAYAQQCQLLESIWDNGARPGIALEGALKKRSSLRAALAGAGARLRAAAEYAHRAVRVLDDAMPAWKLTAIAKSGWERTSGCADACVRLVEARCLERGARRVLHAHGAPRAARSLRLAMDYAFTDAMHDHKYQRVTEIFLQFKDALVQLIDSIHQVLLNNLENLAEAEKDVVRCRRELQSVRVNAIVNKGLAELRYKPKGLTHLNINEELS